MMIGEQAGRALGEVRDHGDDPTAGAPAATDLELTLVTEHGWRVRERRGSGRLLAFVERRGDVFEVMQLGAGFEWHEFATLPDAIAFVAATAMELLRQRVSGPLAWID